MNDEQNHRSEQICRRIDELSLRVDEIQEQLSIRDIDSQARSHAPRDPSPEAPNLAANPLFRQQRAPSPPVRHDAHGPLPRRNQFAYRRHDQEATQFDFDVDPDEADDYLPYPRNRRDERRRYGNYQMGARPNRAEFDVDDRRDDRRHWHPNTDFKVKLELGTFNGIMDPEIFLDWLESVNKYFELVYVPEEQRVSFVSYKLESGAALWWKREQENRRKSHLAPIDSWPAMEMALRGRFLPLDYGQVLYNRL